MAVIENNIANPSAAGGGGGGGTVLNAENGLSLRNPQTVILGGTLDQDTTIQNDDNTLLIEDSTAGGSTLFRIAKPSILRQISTFVRDGTKGEESGIDTISTSTVIETNQDGPPQNDGKITVGHSTVSLDVSQGGVLAKQISIQQSGGIGRTVFTPLPQDYASDAAAAADGTLPVGGIYRIGNDLRIKT